MYRRLVLPIDMSYLICTRELHGDNFFAPSPPRSCGYCPRPHPIPDALVKNHNFCHKSISNLHFKYKHTQTNTIRNTASAVLVIVQSSSSSDEAVCPARRYTGRYKPMNRLTTRLSASSSLSRLYRDICPRYQRYCCKIYSVFSITGALPRYYHCPHYCAAL